MKAQVFQKQLKAVRDFGAVALFTAGSILYYHGTAPEQSSVPQNPEAKHAFVDANPIRLHWLTAAFKSDETAKQTPEQTAAQKSAFLDGKPIRLGK